MARGDFALHSAVVPWVRLWSAFVTDGASTGRVVVACTFLTRFLETDFQIQRRFTNVLRVLKCEELVISYDLQLKQWETRPPQYPS